jgi:hypothetical protein
LSVSVLRKLRFKDDRGLLSMGPPAKLGWAAWFGDSDDAMAVALLSYSDEIDGLRCGGDA